MVIGTLYEPVQNEAFHHSSDLLAEKVGRKGHVPFYNLPAPQGTNLF